MKIKRIAYAALIAGMAIALTGCLNLRGNLNINRDAKINGTLTMELSKQFAALAGITSTDALKSQFDSDMAGADATISETDQAYVIKANLRDRTMNTDGFSVTRVGDQIKFAWRMGDGSASTTGDEFGLSDMTLGQLDLTVQFPGEIQQWVGSAQGASLVDARTLRIKTPLTSSTMNYRYTASSTIAPPESYALPVAIGAVSVIAAAVVIGVVFTRRRSRKVEEDAEAPSPPTPVGV